VTNNLVELSRDGEIAVILINNPPVNALGPGVAEGIAEAIENVVQDSQTKAALLMGAGKTFIAGADIKEFGKITLGQRAGSELGRLLSKLEDCPKPTIPRVQQIKDAPSNARARDRSGVDRQPREPLAMKNRVAKCGL